MDDVVIDQTQTYLLYDQNKETDLGVDEECVIPVLSGDDNIFSDLNFALNKNVAGKKASNFVAEFTRVFAMKKNPERTYSKFVQNMSEFPDVELDWIFKSFRAIFLFSSTNEDYYCITLFNEKKGTYESSTGPLKEEDYKSVAEDIMQKVG